MSPVTYSAVPSALRRSHRFAPGDLVVRYVNDEPFICLVVGVEDNQHVRVTCRAWPSGYTAVVQAQDVVRLAHPNP